MITIRKFDNNDLTFVQQINFLYWLQIQYCSAYARENVFTAVNENNEILGVGSLSFHGTWYAMDLDILHKLKYDLVIRDDSEQSIQAKSLLIEKLIEKLNEYKQKMPDKRLCICTWIENSDTEEMQFLLTKGFAMSAVAPVLKYDLTKEIKHYKIPQNIKIKEYPMNEESADAYIEASAAANGGLGESKAEILFNSGGGNFKMYIAEDNGKIVSSVSLWDISEGRSATENIFTLPEYRRQNIARETIASGLEHLKSSGKQIATLSVEGENLNAIRLYQSIGYELMYHLIEACYYIPS